MQRNFDVQKLGKIFAVLRAETHCNLTFVECLIELELIVAWLLRTHSLVRTNSVLEQ